MPSLSELLGKKSRKTDEDDEKLVSQDDLETAHAEYKKNPTLENFLGILELAKAIKD